MLTVCLEERVLSPCFHSVIRLRERSALILGEEAVYTLYVLRERGGVRYLISVSWRGEKKCRCFGTSAVRAEKILRSLAVNGVTPCTLGEIAQDLAVEERLEHRLLPAGKNAAGERAASEGGFLHKNLYK